MSISEHAEQFGGLPVRPYDPEKGIEAPESSAYRLSADYDSEEPFDVLLGRFLEDPNAAKVKALVIGCWQGDESDASSEPVVEALVAAREKLPALRALFLGDITYDENEISWIQQCDVTALFDAFPALEEFRARGGNDLAVGAVKHANLKTLIAEAGGLGAALVRGLVASDLPKLEHLELWLGTEDYNRTVTLDDLEPILQGKCFPALRRLGIRNAAGADDLAAKVADAPILERIDVLDLSGGDMSDAGVLALAASPKIAHLRLLDIHHHFASQEAVDKLKAVGVEVDDSDRNEGEDDGGGRRYRYIMAAE